MADLGYFSLVIAFIIAIYAVVAFILGIKLENQKIINSAKGAVYTVAILAGIASISLIYLLVTSDFSIKYVVDYTNRDLPLVYKFSAFWAGNAGSMSLWMLLLAIYAAIVVKQNKIKDMTPVVAIILLINIIFFLFLITFITNPFEKLPFAPTDGSGLNPQLQNTGMIIHPVTTYLGYVGFAVPFAFAMAALILRRSDDQWIKVTRRWTILAWMFLSVGNIVGGQWSYVELGWGGYWAWDPVENASFIPWLTGSAFLHSVMIQERKNMLKIWNVVLIIATYILTLFGTFLVRSGILSSVHAFAENPWFGKTFLIFTLVFLAFALFLVFDRMKMLKEEREFESFISKESSFMLNNLILVTIAFTTFLGTVFPILSQAVRGTKIAVKTPFFDTIVSPFGVALLILLGICPLIGWRKADIKGIRKNFIIPLALSLVTGVLLFVLGIRKIYPLIGFTAAAFAIYSTLFEVINGVMVRMRMTKENPLLAFGRLVVRNRRRYGGYVIHLGLIMIIIGIIGSHAYNTEVDKNLQIGQSANIRNYTLTYSDLGQRKVRGNNDSTYAVIDVFNNKTNKSEGTLEPAQVKYQTHPQPANEVAILSSLKEDIYVILAGGSEDGSVTFRFLLNPLMAWLWIGGYVMVAGTIFALWPGRGSEVGPKYTQRS